VSEPGRRPLMAGNWKMHKTTGQARDLASALVAGAKDDRVEVMIAPPFTALATVAGVLAGSPVQLGAQNLYPAPEGAYTGEVSPAMLVDLGVSYAILGHSERRQIFGESDEFIRQKVAAALEAGLKPVLCVGETLDQRRAGETTAVVEGQLHNCLKGLEAGSAGSLTIAYEPVWAIGTGQTATAAQAEEVHRFIRTWLAGRFDNGLANSVRILYGGSVKADNVRELMSEPDIDGALVGGASLDARSFLAIVGYKG